MSAAVSEERLSSKRIVSFQEELERVRRRFNETSFLLNHSLHGHPLFELPELIGLARHASCRPGDVYMDAGHIKVDDKWGKMPITDLTTEEALSRIEQSGAWVIIKHCELDPRYGKVLRDYSDEILEGAEPALRSALKNPEMLVIVSSPNRITSFHIDGEVNFLLQIKGKKLVHVFDRNDRQVLTEEEIERFYSADPFAPTFKPGTEDRATAYELTPGLGVHIPINCPHWVQNGPQPSVSVSVNFEIPAAMRANIYRVNALLRRFGVNPTPPGKRAACDWLKSHAYSLARKFHRKANG